MEEKWSKFEYFFNDESIRFSDKLDIQCNRGMKDSYRAGDAVSVLGLLRMPAFHIQESPFEYGSTSYSSFLLMHTL